MSILSQSSRNGYMTAPHHRTAPYIVVAVAQPRTSLVSAYRAAAASACGLRKRQVDEGAQTQTDRGQTTHHGQTEAPPKLPQIGAETESDHASIMSAHKIDQHPALDPGPLRIPYSLSERLISYRFAQVEELVFLLSKKELEY